MQAEHNKANHREKQTQLTAPVAGIIQQLAIHSVGGMVALGGQIFLGDDKFIDKMNRLAGQKLDQQQAPHASQSHLEIPQAKRRPRPLPLVAFANQFPDNHNAALQAAYATGGYTMVQLAQYFGMHYTSVSRIVKKAGV